MKGRIVIVAVVAILGAILGYLGSFIQFKNESAHGSEYSSWEHEWLMFPALPGVLISSALRPFDYQLTQHWTLDKHGIALWNGLVFAVLAVPPTLLIRRKRKASKKSAAGDALRRA